MSTLRSPHPNTLPPPKMLAMLFEVYARAGVDQQRAAHLLGRQGVSFTIDEAAHGLAAAFGRNDLKLINVAESRKSDH